MFFFKSKSKSKQPIVELSDAELGEIHGGQLSWELQPKAPELIDAAISEIGDERRNNMLLPPRF
jgi:hypothetical protein